MQPKPSPTPRGENALSQTPANNAKSSRESSTKSPAENPESESSLNPAAISGDKSAPNPQNAPAQKPQSPQNAPHAPISYDPHDIEPRYYAIWEERGLFGLDANRAIQNGKNFSLMMPPPNVTGVLHMGHALTYSLQDIIVRFKRMDGYRTLWQPGTDHAGIATQNVVEKQLLVRGVKKEDLGREAFLREVWAWKEKSGSTIISQLKRLGASPQWERLRFTMDEGLQNAVKKAFVAWFDAGLIYQGDYMVNWCTHDGALSDIEVEHEENKGQLYYLRYFLTDSPQDSPDSPRQNSGESKIFANPNAANPAAKPYIVVATTRPETYFGDTAVMVNPQDSRYAHLIGRKIRLPLIGREIPIIADESVDMGFGSGAVKVTPSHDYNDYEVGKRHNLDFLSIFDKNGILGESCGEFAGLERLAAREKIIARLESGGFVEKIEEHTNQVGRCYRCGNVVEPYISRQWFVSPKIAERTIELVRAKEARFFPAQWLNNFNAWMSELRPWCISRQLWWGHRIPIFYCDKCGTKKASVKNSEVCESCGGAMRQDSDVLDTWFSSGLWAFSTLGWGNEGEGDDSERSEESNKNNRGESRTSPSPSWGLLRGGSDFGIQAPPLNEKSEGESKKCNGKAAQPAKNDESLANLPSDSRALPQNPAPLYAPSDLADFYPNSLLITSFDILFFWVARMLFSGESLLGRLPFKDIYLHALVCDENGQKMSKSRGNVIDPLELIRGHSSDILRFSLAYLCVQGRDIRVGENSLNIGAGLALKVINALNFLLLYKSQLLGGEGGGESEKTAGDSAQDSRLDSKDSPAAGDSQDSRSVKDSADSPDSRPAQDSADSRGVQDSLDSPLAADSPDFLASPALDSLPSPAARYIAHRFDLCVRDLRESLENYRFNDAASAIYRFLFNDFCDWGIELCKAQKALVFELCAIFSEAMKALHPFMPFLSEFVWQKLRGTNLADSPSIMVEKFPIYRGLSPLREFEILKDVITSIRRAKVAIECANKPIPRAFVKLNAAANLDVGFITKLAKVERVEFVAAKVEHCVFDIGAFCEIYLPTSGVDVEALRQKIAKKEEKIAKEIAKLEGMLNNPNFAKNAPPSLIEANREALEAAKEKLKKLQNERAALG